jgi:hypothetical protein
VKMTGEEIGNFHYGYVGSYLFDSTTLKVVDGQNTWMWQQVEFL